MNFAWLNGSEDAEALRDEFARQVEAQLGWVKFDERQEAFIDKDLQTWSKKVDTLISILNYNLDHWAKENG